MCVLSKLQFQRIKWKGKGLNMPVRDWNMFIRFLVNWHTTILFMIYGRWHHPQCPNYSGSYISKVFDIYFFTFNTNASLVIVNSVSMYIFISVHLNCMSACTWEPFCKCYTQTHVRGACRGVTIYVSDLITLRNNSAWYACRFKPLIEASGYEVSRSTQELQVNYRSNEVRFINDVN